MNNIVYALILVTIFNSLDRRVKSDSVYFYYIRIYNIVPTMKAALGSQNL